MITTEEGDDIDTNEESSSRAQTSWATRRGGCGGFASSCVKSCRGSCGSGIRCVGKSCCGHCISSGLQRNWQRVLFDEKLSSNYYITIIILYR